MLGLRRWSVAGAVIGTFGLVLSACGGGGDAQSITLYNGQHPQVTAELVSAFEHQTGITVRVHSGEGPQIANQILAEGKSSPADVYFTENSPELMELQHKGLLAHLDPSTLAQVPAADSSPKGDWVGVVARVDVLAYDPAQVSSGALPRSLLDLARPEWKGRVGIAPADADFLPLVSAVAALHGRAAALRWLRGLAANAQIFQDEEAVVAAVNRGSVATGIVNNYYWFRMRTELGAAGTHCELHYFGNHDVGDLVNVSGAGVLASSTHPSDAQRFVAFLVSRRAQRLLAASEVDFEYPLRPGVAPNPQLRPFDELSPPPLSVAHLGSDQFAAGLLRQAGLL